MRAAFSEICPILQSYTLSRNGSFTLGFENHEQLYQLIQEAREQHDLLKQEFEKNFKPCGPKCNSTSLRKKARFFLRSSA